MLGGSYTYFNDCYVRNGAGHSGIHFFGGQTSNVVPVQYSHMRGNIVNGFPWNYAFDGDNITCSLRGNISQNPANSHFSIDSTQSATGIRTSNIALTGNVGTGGGTGSNSYGILLNKVKDSTVSGCEITGFAGVSLLHIVFGSPVVTGNKFTGSFTSAPQYCLFVQEGNECNIAHNQFKNALIGLNLTHSSPQLGRISYNDFISVTTLYGGDNPLAYGTILEGNRQFDSSFNLIEPFNVPIGAINPPVSATVYQNVSGSTLLIDQPCYATSGGTSGSLQAAVGPTNTPTVITTKYISGSTTSSLTDLTRIEVPPWQYYAFTAAGVTLATATIVRRS